MYPDHNFDVSGSGPRSINNKFISKQCLKEKIAREIKEMRDTKRKEKEESLLEENVPAALSSQDVHQYDRCTCSIVNKD